MTDKETISFCQYISPGYEVKEVFLIIEQVALVGLIWALAISFSHPVLVPAVELHVRRHFDDLHVLHTPPPAGRGTGRADLAAPLTQAETLAQLVEVDLSGGLSRPVSGLLGNLKVSGGVVIGRLRLPHGAVGVTKGPASSPLTHLT